MQNLELINLMCAIYTQPISLPLTMSWRWHADLPTLKNKNSYFDIQKFIFCTKNSYFSELFWSIISFKTYAKQVDNSCFSLWRSCLSGANSFGALYTHCTNTKSHRKQQNIKCIGRPIFLCNIVHWVLQQYKLIGSQWNYLIYSSLKVNLVRSSCAG